MECVAVPLHHCGTERKGVEVYADGSYSEADEKIEKMGDRDGIESGNMEAVNDIEAMDEDGIEDDEGIFEDDDDVFDVIRYGMYVVNSISLLIHLFIDDFVAIVQPGTILAKNPRPVQSTPKIVGKECPT